MAGSEDSPGKKVEHDVFEIDIGSGRRLEIRTTVETGPPEAFGLLSPASRRSGRIELAKNVASSTTYLLLVILCFKRISESGGDSGYRVAMILTLPLFVWLGLTCIVGPRAIFTLDGSEERMVKVIRLVGLVGLLPMILVTQSLL